MRRKSSRVRTLRFLVEQLDALGPEPGKGGDLTELARQLLFQRVEEIEMAGIDNAGDLFSQVLADSGKLRQVGSSREHASDALRQGFDDPCSATISAHTKWILSLNFE